MDRMKVLNKAEIAKLLEEGKTIRYYDLEGKVYMMDGNEKIGAIRFETYLYMPRKKVATGWNFKEYCKE